MQQKTVTRCGWQVVGLHDVVALGHFKGVQKPKLCEGRASAAACGCPGAGQTATGREGLGGTRPSCMRVSGSVEEPRTPTTHFV